MRVGRLPSTAAGWAILRLSVVTDIVDLLARILVVGFWPSKLLWCYGAKNYAAMIYNPFSMSVFP